jgi:subtilisin family serine protease
VTLEAGAPRTVLGLRATPLWAGSRTFLVRPAGGASPAALRRLARLPGVGAVEPDRVRTRLAAPDPLLDRQPHLSQIGWTPSPAGLDRPLVAVLDTGVDAAVPDLAGVVDEAAARSYVPGSPDALRDREGHGTHVAGILAAVAGNGVGGAGVAAARVLPVKIADFSGQATTSSLVRGLRYAAARSARVINVSFGGQGYSRLEQEAVDDAVSAGALVVAAAGNSGESGSSRQYPGAYRHVLAVAAVDGEDRPLPRSTRGPQVAIAAPGLDILSTAPAGRYATRTGTSMATPMVSGAAARLIARMPSLAASQVRQIVVSTARDVGRPGRDPATGWGVLDLAAATAAPVPPPDSAEPNDDPAQARTTRPLLTMGGPAAGAVRGRIEEWSDPRDDYRVALAAGDRLEAHLQGPADADFDLVLWRPGTPRFEPGAAFARRWLAGGAVRPGAGEALRVRADAAGVYTLEVRCARGSGRYRLAARRVA